MKAIPFDKMVEKGPDREVSSGGAQDTLAAIILNPVIGRFLAESDPMLWCQVYLEAWNLGGYRSEFSLTDGVRIEDGGTYEESNSILDLARKLRTKMETEKRPTWVWQILDPGGNALIEEWFDGARYSFARHRIVPPAVNNLLHGGGDWQAFS